MHLFIPSVMICYDILFVMICNFYSNKFHISFFLNYYRFFACCPLYLQKVNLMTIKSRHSISGKVSKIYKFFNNLILNFLVRVVTFFLEYFFFIVIFCNLLLHCIYSFFLFSNKFMQVLDLFLYLYFKYINFKLMFFVIIIIQAIIYT